ncbi:hypothetical protein D3C76_1294650 [compost metagenome]
MSVQPELQLQFVAGFRWAVEQASGQQQAEERAAAQTDGQLLRRLGAEQPAEQPGEEVVDAAQSRARTGVLYFAPEAEMCRGQREIGVAHLSVITDTAEVG